MEQTLTEKTMAVAVWAGAVEDEAQDYFMLNGKVISLNENSMYHWPVLTDLNVLHPIAMRLLDELRALPRAESTNKALADIAVHCSTKPNEQGQYIDLLNAVHSGIELLNTSK